MRVHPSFPVLSPLFPLSANFFFGSVLPLGARQVFTTCPFSPPPHTHPSISAHRPSNTHNKMAPFTLSSNLQLLTDPDADRRFMALSDIAAQYKLKTTFDNATQLKIIHAVMQTMKGAGEVGGEAVKW